MTTIGSPTSGASVTPVRFQGQAATATADSIPASSPKEQPPQGYGAECGTAALFALLGSGYLLRKNPAKIMELVRRLPVGELRQHGARLLRETGERLPQLLKRLVK